MRICTSPVSRCLATPPFSLHWLYEQHGLMSVPVVLPKALHEVLTELIDSTRSLVPNHDIHSFLLPATSAAVSNVPGEQTPKSSRLPLHISLTHPLPLRRSQIRSFRDDLAHRLGGPGGLGGLGELGGLGAGVTEGSGFRLSLAQRVSGYVNGRRYGGEGVGGRAFLALRVGAGSKEVSDVLYLPSTRRVVFRSSRVQEATWYAELTAVIP